MEENDASLRSPQPDCTWQASARTDRCLRCHRGLSCDPVSTGAELTSGPSQSLAAIRAFRIPLAPGSGARCRLPSQNPHDQVLLQTPPDMRKGAGVLPVGGAVSGPVILDQEGAAFTLARRSVSGAGFALPRDARPHREDWPEVGVPRRPRASSRISDTRVRSREIGVAQRRRCRFRAPARCRSETGAPSRPRASSPSAIRGSAAVRLAWHSVVGAGFALPRDAGQRPALQAVPAILLGQRYAVSLP